MYQENQNLEILVIDQNSIANEEIERSHLKTSNPYQITRCDSGLNAIHYLEVLVKKELRKIPDVIILELDLPDMHGRDILSFLKLDRLFQEIPVIVHTASPKLEDIAEAKTWGVCDYIRKGFGNTRALQESILRTRLLPTS